MHARPTHPTGIPQQSRHGWSRRHITWSVAIIAALGLALIISTPVQARTFQCRAGDVRCLIAAITQANAQAGPSHEIRLAAGVYTLTQVHNPIDGANGLPSITCNLTIRGAGAELTTIERNDNTPAFRLIHVAATGALTLEGLTLTGGNGFLNGFGAGGGLLNQGGTLVLTDAIRNCSTPHGIA
jgi:hypothetical protein